MKKLIAITVFIAITTSGCALTNTVTVSSGCYTSSTGTKVCHKETRVDGVLKESCNQRNDGDWHCVDM